MDTGRPKAHVIRIFDGLLPQTQTNVGIPFHPTETLEVQIIGSVLCPPFLFYVPTFCQKEAPSGYHL